MDIMHGSVLSFTVLPCSPWHFCWEFAFFRMLDLNLANLFITIITIANGMF